MTTQSYLPEESVIQRAIRALMNELGPVETARFLSMPRYRYPDYVQWHRQWQETLDEKQFLDQVFGEERQ